MVNRVELPIDEFKNDLKKDIDFILKGKELLSQEDIHTAFRIISSRIAIYSHNVYDAKENEFYRRYMGHRIRKDFKKELNKVVNDHLDTRRREFINEFNIKHGLIKKEATNDKQKC